MLLMIGKWWDGWVWMVVVLGFGFVHGGEREVKTEGEEKRQKLERGERWYWIIYFIV